MKEPHHILDAGNPEYSKSSIINVFSMTLAFRFDTTTVIVLYNVSTLMDLIEISLWPKRLHFGKDLDHI